MDGAAAAATAAARVAAGRPSQVRQQLRFAIGELQLRGLQNGAKWAAEQLTGLADEADAAAGSASARLTSSNMQSDLYLLAKTVFDAREYARCAALLDAAAGGASALNPLEKFLRWYATYLAGERRKEAELLEGRQAAVNEELEALLRELQDQYQRDGLDAFGLWLLGVVLRDLSLAGGTATAALDALDAEGTGESAVLPPGEALAQRAIGALAASLLQFPLNWSGWLDLCGLCVEKDVLPEGLIHGLPQEQRWVYAYFLARVLTEQQQPQGALELLQALEPLFPQSAYLLSANALAHYALRAYDAAEANFTLARLRDPHRLEHLDVLSDILFVKEARRELSHLAREAARVDKFRAETCVAIGNYYSLKRQHERAVLYFKRALRCDRKCLAAWILIGHEYLELKNTGAAIEAYRKAVDVNPRDFRAWYGLGQTYEILQMFAYALHYYGKAAALKPYDARMWCALGFCYQRLERRLDAIRCYERAVANDDQEGLATMRLARLYAERAMPDKAAANYRRHVETRAGAADASEGGSIYASTGAPPSADTVEALLFLAAWHRKRSEFIEAVACCHRVLEYPGQSAQEEAKGILRQIRSQQQQAGVEESHDAGTSMRSSQAPRGANGLQESLDWSGGL